MTGSSAGTITYFAYGSNLDPVQMRARCPGHHALGTAWLPEYRLCFPRCSPTRKCATAGLIAHAGESVWGALYRMTVEDVSRLHTNEGYWPEGPPEQNRHIVVDIEVLRAGPSGSPVPAYTYFALADESGALPSTAYIGHLIRGAAHHGLPASYIAALQSIVTEEPAI